MKVTHHEHRGRAEALLSRSGYGSGKHVDAAQDRALVREMVKPAALKRARGGHVKEPHGKKAPVVNIVIAHPHDPAAMAPVRPAMVAPPGMPPGAPRAPVGPGPMMPPGLGAPPPVMKRGGAVRGGVPMTAGAGGAEGRIEKARLYGRRGS